MCQGGEPDTGEFLYVCSSACIHNFTLLGFSTSMQMRLLCSTTFLNTSTQFRTSITKQTLPLHFYSRRLKKIHDALYLHSMLVF